MAMHCPQCLTEYRDGFTECADCRVALAPGPPPKSTSESHKVELVTVLETSEPFLLNLAKSTLEDGGVDYVIEGDEPEERSIVMPPTGAPQTRIRVATSCADEARELLEPLLHPQPLEEDAETA